MIFDHAHELLQDQQRITQQAVADWRRTSQSGIGGDLQQFAACGQVLTGHIRVVTENLGADHDHEVMPTHRLSDTGNCHRQWP